MKSLFTPVIAGLSLVSASTLAAYDDDYQHEVSISAADNTSDSKSDTHWKGNYTYYAKAIDQTDGPYRLNAFLAQTSHVSLMYGHQDNNDDYGIQGKLFLPRHWFIAGEYQRREILGDDVDVYHFEVGNYINEFTKVYVSAERKDVNDSKQAAEEDAYRLGIKSFISLPGDTGILLKAAYIYKDSEYNGKSTSTDNVKLEADYYFNRAFSVSAHFGNGDNDDADYGVKADYFLRLSDNISLDLSADKYFEDDDKNDGVYWIAELIGRF